MTEEQTHIIKQAVFEFLQRQLALVAGEADTCNICSSVTSVVAEIEPAVRMGHEWDANGV